MGSRVEDCAHQLVVFRAILRRTGLQRDLGRQLESGKRMRKLDRVQRLLLVRYQCGGVHRCIAEPIARRGRSTGPLFYIVVEFL